jgi:YVTN family beta-propeller protein
LRRTGIVAAIVAALVLVCLAASNASAAPLAYTANYNTNSVSVIDTATNKVVGEPIQLGTGGTHALSIAVTPNGRFAYALEEDAVSVISTATRQVIKTIPVGSALGQVSTSPDGKTAYATDEGAKELLAIDTATNGAPKPIPLTGFPLAVSITPDGRYAYVSLRGEEAVEVIDTQTAQSLGRIPVGEGPVNIAFTPDGQTAYVVNESSENVTVIDTATRHAVDTIPVGEEPWGVAVTPDGTKAYVVNLDEDSISVIATATNKVVGTIPVGEEPYEVAFTPSGRTAYVAEYGSEDVTAIDTATNQVVGTPIPLPGAGPWQIAITPDQSPTATFTPPSATAGIPAVFTGAASTDPDGSVVSWSWAFGDGTTATGVAPSHTYGTSGIYNAQLSVLDDEGCGEAEVSTGRTAYCSGNPLAKATHPVDVKAPTPAPTPAKVCSAKFGIGGASHNRRNGTVRLRVNLHTAGSLLLTGPKIHAVTRKVTAAGSMLLTIHARVELNKRLKKVHRASVRFRVTFTPAAGCGFKTVHRSIALQRAPRRKHHR